MYMTPDIWISLPEKDGEYAYHTQNPWFGVLKHSKKLITKTVTLQLCL